MKKINLFQLIKEPLENDLQRYFARDWSLYSIIVFEEIDLLLL